MPDTLATAADLTDFPGSPFDEELVQVAQASVRTDAGWHIAPERTETLYLVGRGSAYLTLPTRKIVEVTAVRVGPNLTEYTSGWTVMGNALYMPGGWTAGPVEVDLTHGYAETPLELLPVIVNRVTIASNPRDPSVAGYTTVAGPFSNTERYRSDAPSDVDPRIAAYALLPGVA